MLNDDQLKMKLAQYASLALGVFAFRQPADAQIIYTDVSPDAILTYAIQPNSFTLDLNHDGITDFVIQDFQRPFFFTVAMIGVEGRNSFLGNYTSGYSIFEYNAFELQSGNSIPSAKNYWLSPPAQASLLGGNILAKNKFNGGILYGHWQNGVTNGFIGLKFYANDTVYYGWVRLDVSKHADEITVKDYAYNSIPGAPIMAGEGIVSGIEPLNSFYFSIYPNPASSYLILSIPDEKADQTMLTIYNEEGQPVFRRELNESSAKNPIDIHSLPAGTYFVEVRNRNGVARKELPIVR